MLERIKNAMNGCTTNKAKKIGIALSVLFFTLAGCKTTPPRYPTTLDNIHSAIRGGIAADSDPATRGSSSHQRIPTAVSKALLPPMTAEYNSSSEPKERRFDVVADKLPAKAFFMGLVDGTRYNMVVNPNVDGVITLNLKDVTVEEAMQAVRDVYGYDYRRTPYGYEVLPRELQTQLFTLNYLDVQRKGKSLTQVSSGQISQQVSNYSVGPAAAGQTTSEQVQNTSSVDTRSEMNFWHELTATLQSIVGTDKGRSVVVNTEAGVIIVHAFPSELRQVARYLDRIQTNMKRQVILEAKVLEVSLNDSFQAGIDWNLFGKGLDQTLGRANSPGGASQTAFETFREIELRDFRGIFAVNVQGDFGALIKLLQAQGNVQVLSSPRISTVNNQKAIIKVGQDEFFVTGVSTTNTIVGNNTLPSQDVSLTPFFSGITLDVTPQISNTGNVILHIHPTVSDVKDQEKRITVGSNSNGSPNDLVLPLALSTIRESDNIVQAQNGQVIVIGGLMQTLTSERIAGTPGVSKIPFIGALFRRTEQISKKTELVILLRPMITNKQVFKRDMQKTDNVFHRLHRGFHAGGQTEDFGNEGEMEDT
jgi:MSHA biogenesis protein MshL